MKQPRGAAYSISKPTEEPVFCFCHSLNSIAFGSAPRREAVSHPISQLARPSDRNTQFGFFVSGRPGSMQWGEPMFSRQALAEW